MKKIASLSTAGLFLFLLVLFVLRSANADSLNLETGESEWATNREIADNNRLVPAHSKGETMALRMQAAAWVLMQEEGGMTPEILKYYMANGFDNWREEDQDILEKWFLKYASRDSALENLVKIIGAREEKKRLVIEDVSE